MEFDLNQPQDSLDKIPDQFKPIFAPGADGKFTVDPKFKGVADALTGFNKTTQTLRNELKTKTTVDLTPLAEFGTDPAAIKAAFDARVAELTAKGGDAARAVEKVRSEMTAAHQAALTAEQNRSRGYQGQLHANLIRSEAVTAIAEAKGVPDLLMPFLQTQVKVVEADGRMNIVVLDDKGEPRYSGVTGQPMTVKELVTAMKADPKFARLFDSDQQGGGGGMPPGGGRQAPRTPLGGQQEKSANAKIASGLKARFPTLAGRG